MIAAIHGITRIHGIRRTTSRSIFTEAANPVTGLSSLLTCIHSYGLPWWLAITVATVGLRTVCTLPLAIQNKRRSHRLNKLQPILKAWELTLGFRARQGNDAVYKQMYRRKALELYRLHRCNPLYTFVLPWVQIPLFISMSFAIRRLAAFPMPMFDTREMAVGMDSEGTLWFDSLAVADPTLITPVLIAALHLLNLELSSSRGGVPINLTQRSTDKGFKLFLQSLSILSIPIACHVPMVNPQKHSSSNCFIDYFQGIDSILACLCLLQHSPACAVPYGWRQAVQVKPLIHNPVSVLF